MGQFLTVFLVAVLYSSQSFAAVDLNAAFQAALSQSETLASQERLVLIAEEHYSQAKGSLLPNLAINASYMIQDSPADPLAATFFPRFQPELKVTVRQPIFRGLREFAALRQSKSLINAEKYARESAIQFLYTDVSKSYHMVLGTEENLRSIQDQIKIVDDRTKELERRVQAGTSNETDLLAAQAARAKLKAELRTTQASISGARDAFAFLTALPSDTPLTPLPYIQHKLEPLANYLKEVERRPDIQGLTDRLQVYEDNVRIAKGAHAPNIDLLGNYYLKRQSEIYRGITWDVQAALSFPIFSGGVISSQVTESSLQKERADLELTRLRRQAEQQTRTLYNDYKMELESITDLEESVTLSEKNYQLLKRDFGRGLVRNLDVLQALTAAHEIRLELLRARFVARDKWVELNRVSGRPLFNKGT